MARRRSIGELSRIHAEQGDASEDEREHRGIELGARCVAAGRDGRAGPQGPQHVRKRGRADRVDGAGPPLRLERLAGGGHLVPRQDPGRTQSAQALRLVGLCRSRPRPRSQGRRGSPGRPPDPAAGAGHEDRPVAGLQAAFLECSDGHRSGEPGRADGHGVALGEAVGQGYDPAGRDALVLAVPAMPGDAQVIAVRHHRRTHRDRRDRTRRRPSRPGRCLG